MNKAVALFLVTVATCLNVSAAVTLTESQVQWKTFKHTVNADYSLLNDTFSTDIVTHTYKSLVVENEYLKVTLVPDFGGRIISMIYKPTGHEQLYQNPVGTPYGPDWDAFYYDWLMVWGGIFPTFPEPEHGKAWCRPWTYEIIRNTAQEVSVKMSFTDDINFKSPPAQFKYGTTGITCHFEVSLAAQSSALKTTVTLVNSKNGEIPFEYWTNMGVAPGSVPGNTRCDDQTEIVGPVNHVKISSSWPEIRKVEQNESGDIYGFKNLRWYKNWADDGIAYAWPVEGNFWGALNHANNEAILRISENLKTPGLKLWGFGYNRSRGFNPETSTDYHRPFIEMWAGVSKEFFTPAKIPANSTIQFDEYYTPVVGLTSFTHASERAVVDLTTDKAAYNGAVDKNTVVSCRYVVTQPADPVTLSLQFRGGSHTVAVYEGTGAHDVNGPFEIKDTVAVQDLCNDINRMVFELRSDSKVLMSSEIPVTFTNAGSCVTSLRPEAHQPQSARSDASSQMSRKLYSINGAYVSEAGGRRGCSLLPHGVFVASDKQGRCFRFVDIAR